MLSQIAWAARVSHLASLVLNMGDKFSVIDWLTGLGPAKVP